MQKSCSSADALQTGLDQSPTAIQCGYHTPGSQQGVVFGTQHLSACGVENHTPLRKTSHRLMQNHKTGAGQPQGSILLAVILGEMDRVQSNVSNLRQTTNSISLIEEVPESHPGTASPGDESITVRVHFFHQTDPQALLQALDEIIIWLIP